MSDLHPTSGHPPAEEDRVDVRAVVLIGAASLAIFFLAGLAATTYLRLQQGEHPALPLPPEFGETKVGLVEQRPFGDRLRGERDRAARLAWLEETGWIDPARGVVHLPIERAMALVAAGVRAPPGGPPPPLGAANGGADAPSVPIAPARSARPPAVPGGRP